MQVQQQQQIHLKPLYSIFSALTLLVGWQARHPVARKNLRPLIHHYFDGVGWMREGHLASKNSLQHPQLSRRQPANTRSPGKWSLKKPAAEYQRDSPSAPSLENQT